MSQVDLLNPYIVQTVISLSIAGLLFALYFFLRYANPAKFSGSELPFVSVLVPARNEETKIARCLQSLAEQNYPCYEVLVVDDLSCDGTGTIIADMSRRHPVIRAVPGTANPDCWVGKCNALVQAAAHARGDWFVFTDADTCHNPDSLRHAVSYAIKNKADLVSFKPLQELGSFWELVVMPPLLASFFLGEGLHFLGLLGPKLACAYGQYMIARRSSYEAAGGHKRVHDEIVEDHALAKQFKTQGYKVMLADGRDLYKVRMYVSLETLWHGWIKNLYSFAQCNMLFLVTLLAATNCVVIGPFVCAVIALGLVVSTPFSAWSVLLLLLACSQMLCLFVSVRLTAQHLQGWRWLHFFLIPLGSVTISLLYAASAIKVISGSKVCWKGRSYRVTKDKTIDSVFETDTPDQGLNSMLAGGS